MSNLSTGPRQLDYCSPCGSPKHFDKLPSGQLACSSCGTPIGETPAVAKSGRWASASLGFRRAAFASAVWMLAVPAYLWVTDRSWFMSVVRNRHGYFADDRVQVAATRSIPLLVAAVYWAYRKLVSPSKSET